MDSMLQRKLACENAQHVFQVYVGFSYVINVTRIWQMCHVITSTTIIRNADYVFLKSHASQRCRKLQLQ